MLYELRHYDTPSDRALEALNQRFADHTLLFWDKFGVEAVGFWTTLIGTPAPRLTYLLAWEDLAQRQARWDAFQADPEWQRVRAESTERFGGSLVRTQTSIILQPPAFSPHARRDNQPVRLQGGVFELRTDGFDDVADLSRTLGWFEQTGLPQFERHDMPLMGLWTTYIGVAPRLTYMLVFENLAHRERAWASFYTDPAWQTLQDGLYAGGRPLISSTESCVMKGTEFSGWR